MELLGEVNLSAKTASASHSTQFSFRHFHSSKEEKNPRCIKATSHSMFMNTARLILRYKYIMRLQTRASEPHDPAMYPS